mgnify:CR=1 FL=1
MQLISIIPKQKFRDVKKYGYKREHEQVEYYVNPDEIAYFVLHSKPDAKVFDGTDFYTLYLKSGFEIEITEEHFMALQKTGLIKVLTVDM